VSDSPYVVLVGEQVQQGAGSNLIMIEYLPEWSVRLPFGDRIVLVQSVSRHVDGAPQLPTEFYGPGGSFAWKDSICLTGATTRGMSIDGLATEPQPYYNDSFGTETPKDVARPDWCIAECKYTSLRNRRASVAVDVKGSANTLRYGVSKVDSLPYVSRLTDAPSNNGGRKGFFSSSNPGGVRRVVLNFNVFAFCSKGLCHGEWYEGVAWRFEKTWIDQKNGSPGRATYVGNLDHPSKDFLDAFDLFNKIKGFVP